ncbi:MAG: hypothetical protein K2X87_09955, partial [Gemmataceae bacterium]|nr:hypothetical protein [Gemmataceae bacterium]
YKRKLDLLGGSPTVPVAAVVPAAPAEADPLPEARALFKAGKYAEAATRFAAGSAAGDDAVLWAYCRVKLAADAVNRPGCDPAAAATAADDVAAALKLAPANAKLQQVGQQVLAVARLKAQASGGRKPPVPDGTSDWQVVETASFRVRFSGDRAAAEAVATAAEAKRTAIFARWSGPPAGAWSPKCEVVLHPSAECYARMTGKPAAGTGHATVKLANAAAAERRIDLRADDPALAEVALPRELTHVVLADLFPYTPPPKWAEVGMAVLSGPADEVGRYTRKLPECAAAGEAFAVPALLGLADFPPAGKITGFYCGSVSLVEYLVKLKGERTFVLFLRDAQRYGVPRALQQEYGLADPAALDSAWRQAVLGGAARAQMP